MKNKILISVLAASLAMNLGVAAMFGLRLIQTKNDGNSKACPFVSNDERLYTMLGLTPDQLASIKPLAEKFHSNIEKLSADIHVKRDDMISIIDCDAVDMVLASQVRQEILGLQSILQENVFTHILQVKQVLTPDQRQLFFQIIRRSFIPQSPTISQ
ncbi:MAG: Spy/CpxP family protein refolding chaperone [Solidesulfovibrio sp. DCME]|uniref:Spy/CpxP family protein refolding chaperone n=1 Tax=Solidesulfovibrio sp. DCME TaxID=3447380 RepID=UPI003D0C2C9C